MKKEQRQQQQAKLEALLSEVLSDDAKRGGWLDFFQCFQPDERARNLWGVNSLYDLYNNPSYYKERADEQIRRQLDILTDKSGYITDKAYRGNSSAFSCNFEIMYNNIKLYLYYTAGGDYFYIAD